MAADLILLADTGRAFGTQAQDERYVRYALARFAIAINLRHGKGGGLLH